MSGNPETEDPGSGAPNFQSSYKGPLTCWVPGNPGSPVLPVIDLQLQEPQIQEPQIQGSMVVGYRERWYLLESVYPAGLELINQQVVPRLTTNLPAFNLWVEGSNFRALIRGLSLCSQNGPHYVHQTTVQLNFRYTGLTIEPLAG